MEPVREPLLAALDGLKPADARLPFFSTVTGQGVHGPELGAEYWWHNVRRTVRFADGVEQLIELGCDTVLELGPHPVLTASVSECYQRRGKKVTALYSLRRHEMEGATMRRALGALHVRGWPVDWAGVFAEPCRFVRLPSYPWQRERYWHELEASRDARLNAPSHPLLGWRRRGPAPCWQGRLDLRLFGWLADHRVQRSPIMPAAAYIDLALAAAHEHLGSFACQLEDIQFANPCFLSPERPLHLHTTVSPDDGSVRIHTRVVEGEPEWTLHFSAALRARAADEVHLAPETIQSRCPRQFAGADCFVHFEKIGLDYGPLFKGIQHVWQGENESLGRVELPDGLGADAGDHLFHPALLDACLQVVIPAEKNFQQAAGALYLPIEVERFRLHRRPGRRLWSHARLVDKTSQHVLADLDIYDDAGTLVAEVRGLRSQRVAGRSEEDKLDDLLFSYRWQEQDLAGASGESDGQAAGHWLILADAAVGGRLAEQLRARGQECTVVFRKDGVNDGLDPAAREPIFRLVQEQAPRLRGIVHLWNLDAPAGDDLAVRDLEAAQELGLLSVVHLIQAWDAAGSDRPARLFLVTRGAQPMEDLSRPLAIAQTPALGLGRVIIGEYPRLRCKLVDLDPDDVDGLGPLIDEMLADDEEDEVAYRGGKRYVHRFLPGAPEPAAKTARQGPFRLGSLRPGTIDGLALRPWQRQRPGPGQVEIAVAAAGLNFSDVMKALGIYPGLPDGPVALGAECSGIVTAVGAGVANVRPGEAVLAVAPFSFASHVLTRAEFVVRKPAALSFEQAAATPIAYLTAAYALDCLARLAPGERVLIHSATGGVGLAAIELARRAGAQIFATAGSAEKRDHLRRLGIEHVMDSRSLAFADEVLERTAGRGVDVILNSLAGEAIPRGLAILADHGRFLEIGKRDIYQNSRLGLRPFRKNLSFFAIDLDRMMHTQPALLGTLLEKLVRDLADGRLTPLPVTPYPIAEAADAFRLMQHGKHMGKVVLRVPEAATITDGERPVEGRPADRHPHSSDPRPGEGSYLVVGGLGGFGLAAARWLAQCKAGHLVLVGRRGSRSPDAARAVAELEPLGAGVSVVAADVAREEDVVRLLADIDRTLPPLRGVIHSAMVLEDGLLVKLERTQLYRVLAPKLNGAWNLHRHTRQRQLDFFVLFSSLASVLGHAGQAAYAAANAFLDALAHHRRALGLPALAVNWGHLGEVGYLAVHRDVGARLERQGVLPFTVREALAILERSLEQQQVQVSVMRTDWSRWRAMGVSGRLSPRFAHLGRQAAADSSADLPTLEAVRQAAPDQRRQLLQRLLRAKVARVLGTAPERLDDDKPLLNLGIDSLMAVELRNWIEGELRVNLPIVELMRSPSLSSLSELLSAQLAPAEPAAAATPPPDGERAAPHEGAPERLLANLDELSGEQVDALLSSLLADREAAPRSGAV
jgi:NADPH:quinone reductase-like Zn-dependent oxidoreductase/aryl carrier-like protein